MENSQYGSNKSTSLSIPPLGTLATFGVLQYADNPGSRIAPEISGSIDKGFFVSENEWTCYRRNYFSCLCSFGLAPYYPAASLTFQASGSASVHHVAGFGMSISAVVADSDGQKIDLVQHTPKRDKGPTNTPEKVRMAPKAVQSSGHPTGLNVFGSHGDSSSGAMTSRGMYESAYGQGPPSGPATEHAFERIQFKQATQNNGKRRAAQQYYHLLVELWVEVEVEGPDHTQWMKFAERKSAKMIVRGRSPGHYQSERRNSTRSGPGGAGDAGSGSSSTLGYGSSVMGPEYGSGAGLLLGSGYGGYDSRHGQGGYSMGGRHHSHMGAGQSPEVPGEDAKCLEPPKGLRLYNGAGYGGHHHHSTGRHEQQPAVLPRMGEAPGSSAGSGGRSTLHPAGLNGAARVSVDAGLAGPPSSSGYEQSGTSKVKPEGEHASQGYGYIGSYQPPRSTYEPRPSNSAYFPAMVPPPGLNVS